MPKLKESPQAKQDARFRGLVAMHMEICGYRHQRELAPKMLMHEVTFNYKMADPDRFTRQDLAKLLDRTPRTINRMYADGLPKHMMRGRNYTFGRELLAWIENDQAPAPQINSKLVRFRQGLG